MTINKRWPVIIGTLSLFFGLVQTYLWSMDHGRAVVHAVLAMVFIGGGIYLLLFARKGRRK